MSDDQITASHNALVYFILSLKYADLRVHVK